MITERPKNFQLFNFYHFVTKEPTDYSLLLLLLYPLNANFFVKAVFLLTVQNILYFVHNKLFHSSVSTFTTDYKKQLFINLKADKFLVFTPVHIILCTLMNDSVLSTMLSRCDCL